MSTMTIYCGDQFCKYMKRPYRNFILPAFAAAGLLVVMLLVAGCTGTPGGNVTATPGGITTLKVTGSTTVLPIAQKTADAYMAAHEDTNILITGGGSSVGVQAAGEGTADIGMSSRDVTAEEQAKYPALVTHEIAWDAIVMIVNPANPVNQLSLPQVRGIYNGTYTNWNQVGGQDLAIVVVGRDSASGTRTYFSESIMKNENFTRFQEEFNANGGVQQKISQTRGAIGYVGLGFTDGVRKLDLVVNGTPVEATIDTVKARNYPVSRPLYMLTRGEPAGLAKQYIDFIGSPQGQQIVETEGFISLSG